MSTPSVASEWRRRAGAEYATGAHAQQITLWLTTLGASPDLIADGLAIGADELRHSARCFEVYRAAGGTGGIEIDQAALAVETCGDLLPDLLKGLLRLFCLGETLAVAMFNEARNAASIPLAKEVLTEIVRDEVRHRAFGWDTLGWLLDQGLVSPSMVSAQAQTLIPDFAAWYPEPHVDGVGTTERAWGLMPRATAARLVRRAIEHDWPRRFAALDVPHAL